VSSVLVSVGRIHLNVNILRELRYSVALILIVIYSKQNTARPGSVKYTVAHEKPARHLVEQRGRRSRTLYRKLNKCKCKVLTG